MEPRTFVRNVEFLITHRLAKILTLLIMWMYSMQICGHLCATILLENTSFPRWYPLYVAQYLLICGKLGITFRVSRG